VEAALKKIDGVTKAKADNKTKQADVAYDAAKTSPDKIIQAFNDQKNGYTASVKS
jgi:copper chaperone CopZ